MYSVIRFLNLLVLATLLCSTTANLDAKSRVLVEKNKNALLYTGTIEMTKDPEIRGMKGSGHIDIYVTLNSPKEHKDQRIQILISDRKNSKFPKLATQSDRIVFRARTGAITKKTKFLYESEVSGALTPDRLRKDIICVSELDKYVDLPSGPLPKIPAEMAKNTAAKSTSSKYLVFIDENGKLARALPMKKTAPAIDAASRQYLESAKFKIGKKDGTPTTYYNIVVLLFLK